VFRVRRGYEKCEELQKEAGPLGSLPMPNARACLPNVGETSVTVNGRTFSERKLWLLRPLTSAQGGTVKGRRMWTKSAASKEA